VHAKFLGSSAPNAVTSTGGKKAKEWFTSMECALQPFRSAIVILEHIGEDEIVAV
jgi:hypothetical protein